MRLFVAAVLPDDLRRALEALQQRLASLPLPVRWTHPETMHLTFAFLGETSETVAERIPEALAGALVQGPPPFRLEARGCGTFPGHGRPRVVWVGLQGETDAAVRLKQVVDAALEPLGFRPGDRPFRPHLTLGRVVEGRPGDWREALAAAAQTALGSLDVTALTLFESRLGPERARHLPRATLVLAA
ncbi:MAG TPA: RNA 2',3'-cyclic phosphodiesterase [Candidatus Polarisedimenticolia bacterium]|nr:RNA 2',3'-cyclic phosphodiesterase [Candidatus Polarisedimenticolia bacterium]